MNNQPFNVEGKSIFITGGASGIGLGTSERLLEAGALVSVSDINEPPATLLEKGVRFFKTNVADREQVLDTFQKASPENGKFDALIHNVGTAGRGVHLTCSEEDVLDRVVKVNLYGTYYFLKYGTSFLKDGGSIVTTASVAGLQQNEGYFDYSATKAAVISMTKTAAVELGTRGIRCNVVAPGPVRTPMLPEGHINFTLAKHLSTLGRIAEVDDLVGVYHFLVSDESCYISGQTLVVDGGRLTGYRNEVLARLGVDDA